MDVIYIIILITLFLIPVWQIVTGRARSAKGKLMLSRTTSRRTQIRSRGLAYYTISFIDKEKLYHSAFQMDIYLPEGCSFVAPETWGEYAKMNQKGGVYPHVGTHFDHTIGSALRSENHLFVMLFDGSGKKPFLKHSGRLFDVCIRVPESYDLNNLQLEVKDVQFISAKGTRYYYENQILKVAKP